MRSLLAPLILALVLSLAIVYGAQWSMVARSMDRLMIDYIAEELALDAEELFASLALLPGAEPSLALTHFDPPFLHKRSGRYYQILVNGEPVLRSPSLADDVLTMQAVSPGRNRTEFVPGPLGQELLLHSIGYRIKDVRVTIGVAENLQPIRARFDRLLERYSTITLAMLALLVALQVAIVRFVLGALGHVQSDVARLERGEISQLGERVPREVLPLVREINRLIGLLTARLVRSRQAMGDLAHGLKTPLTVLQHMSSDAFLDRNPVFAEQLRSQVTRLRERIDSELRRARIAGGRAYGKPLLIGPELEGLAGTLRNLYRQKAIEIECRVDPEAVFNGDREDLAELCGNLLDNACKWARCRVRTTVHNGHRLTITVEDDGPGCPPEDIQSLGRRGLRLDEATEGHGLGLAIARSIVASYDGDIGFGRSADLGGFAVEVTIPAT